MSQVMGMLSGKSLNPEQLACIIIKTFFFLNVADALQY